MECTFGSQQHKDAVQSLGTNYIILGEKVDNKDFKHEPLDTQTF